MGIARLDHQDMMVVAVNTKSDRGISLEKTMSSQSPRRFLVPLLASLLLFAIQPHFSWATSLVSLEVAQPIMTEEGIFVSSVTYLVYRGSAVPGDAIGYTAKANVVLMEGSNEPRDANAASQLGLDVRLARRVDVPDWNHPSVDTLPVILDFTHFKAEAEERYRVTPTVQATVECILVNASRSWPPARYVQLEIEGTEGYRSFARVYDLTRMAKPPRRRQFQ